MKKFFAMFFVLFLCSCNTENGNSEAPENKPPFGWRSAGLMPNRDSLNKWGTGFMAIAHSKDYIFVRNSKVADPVTLAPAYRIFMSRQGSEAWEEMRLPSGLMPFKMHGDASGLYVGSYGNGQIWHYEPDSKKWTNLFEMQLKEKQIFYVFAIGKYDGGLLASIAGYNDSTNSDNGSVGLILHMQPGGEWKNISPPDSVACPVYNHMVPLHFNNAREWRGKLFIQSAECGLWVYDNASWQRLPPPPDYKEERDDRPIVIELHKDRLYVGQYSYGGVQEIQEDYSRVQVDSNAATNGNYRKKMPINVKALVSTGEHLIVAGGKPGLPLVYMGDKGEPKGWRDLGYDSWCPPGSFRCIALTTYGLDIAGDTLYAAAWEGVFKFPLPDLDSAIASDSCSYYEDCSYYKED